jgi:hypothetical protein
VSTGAWIQDAVLSFTRRLERHDGVDRLDGTMQRFRTNASFGLPDYSLSPDEGLHKKRSQTLSHGYPTSRSPSLFDCVVHFFDLIIHCTFVDDAIFHSCCSLRCPHSTPSAPHGHRGSNRDSEYCYGIASLRFVISGEGSSPFLGECSCCWHDGWERLGRRIEDIRKCDRDDIPRLVQ